MKKILALALALSMCLAVVSCGNSGSGDTGNAGNTGSSTPGGSTSGDAGNTGTTTPETYDLIWGGTSASSGYYALNVAVCDIINKYVDGVTVTLMETGGTVDDYKLMSTGEASFAQTSDVNEYCLQNNTGVYEGFGYTDSLDMLFFVPQAYRYVVTESSGIKSISELNGQTFCAGQAGSSAEVETMNILTAIGIEPDWFPASNADAVDAIANRQCVGMSKAGTSLAADSTFTGLQASLVQAGNDIRILGFTQEEVDKVQALYPYYGFRVVDTAPYGFDYDTLTYCSSLGFSVSKELPEDVVYNIVKAIDEHLDEIRNAYPGIVDDPFALTNDPSSISLIHPGVVKYMQEVKGMTVDSARIPG